MVDVQQIINEVTKVHGKERKALMPILQAVIKTKNYLDDQDLISVAKALDLSAAEVFGTASFYTFLDTVPRGKNVIRVCKTISCHMAGKDEIIDAIEQTLKVKTGGTTLDRKFTLLSANCLGWCHKGPVMLINDKIFPELTTEKAIEILSNYQEEID